MGRYSLLMFWIRKHQAQLITGDELDEALKDGAAPVIVDVRSEKEYRAGHLPGAIHIPSDELAARASDLSAEALTVFY